MNKSPAALLHELCMKHSLSLNYEEPITLTKTMSSIQFQVTLKCSIYTENGIGTTKKSAKQDAATKMLQLLSDNKRISVPSNSNPVKINKSPENGNDVPVGTNGTENSEDQNENYVGLLNEYCQQRRLPCPIYKEKAASGPSHMPLFTVSCTVGSISKDGTACTKRKAKHKSAWEVLTAYKSSIVPEPGNKMRWSNSGPSVEELGSKIQQLDLDGVKNTLTDEVKFVEDRYKSIKKRPPTAGKVSELHLALRDIMKNIPEDHKKKLIFVHTVQAATITSVIEQAIVNALGIPFVKTYLKTRTCNIFIVALKLCTTPQIVQIGIGNSPEVAENDATRKVLNYIIDYL